MHSYKVLETTVVCASFVNRDFDKLILEGTVLLALVLPTTIPAVIAGNPAQFSLSTTLYSWSGWSSCSHYFQFGTHAYNRTEKRNCSVCQNLIIQYYWAKKVSNFICNKRLRFPFLLSAMFLWTDITNEIGYPCYLFRIKYAFAHCCLHSEYHMVICRKPFLRSRHT